MKFTKMHGVDSGYVYVNCFKETVSCPEEVSRRISDRHFDIGSDGLILIKPSEVTDCRMQMFDADGSEGAIRDNTTRRVGKYVYEHGIVRKASISVETKDRLRFLELGVKGSEVMSVTVDMGEPELISKPPEPITVDDVDYEFAGVSMGSPHTVYFMEEIDGLDLEKIGPAFEHHARFPKRTNTEFIYPIDRSHIRMRVWERSSGETWVCGTGTSASMIASILMGYTDREVEVFLRGGKLVIRWDEGNNHIFITGPTVEVFHREIEM